MASRLPEDVFVHLLRSVYNNVRYSALRSTARHPGLLSRPGSSARHLSTLCRRGTHLAPSITCVTPRESPNASSEAQKRPYSTHKANDAKPRQIAVLGAGITGLTAAHYLARHAKNAHITIYEASNSPGGWIRADRVEVEDDSGQRGHVLFQRGPRMLRSSRGSTKYDDLVLFDVLANLKMDDKIRHPHVVSENRYLYYPDHLVKMPSAELTMDNFVNTLQSLLREPIWSGVFPAMFNYWVTCNKALNPSNSRRPAASGPGADQEDESAAQFLTRILGDDRLVKNIASGMMHGIYGGDINKLSAKHTTLDGIIQRLERPLDPRSGHVWVDLRELFLLYDMLSGPNRLKIIELAETAIDWKLLAFEDGLISLVDGLVKDLETKSNVTFKYGKPVTSLRHEENKVLVTTPEAKQPAQYDHVICTLFSKQLAQITEPRNSLPSLAETHAVTIMVVNLWYPNQFLLNEGGFGYLIPSSTPDNHEGALGVLFDSDLRTGGDEMAGTKLTVMLGGHHWDGWKHFPSEELGIAMAKEVVQRHLGISETEKVVAGARLCRDCLPQHFVGHRKRMKEAHYELMSTFQGRLTVAGPSYTSIGVIPAMRAGYDAGMRVAREHAQPWFRLPEHETQSELDYWMGVQPDENVVDLIGASGLERFTVDEWTYRQAKHRRSLFFRQFTSANLRFRDELGHFVDVDQRVWKNAPSTSANQEPDDQE